MATALPVTDILRSSLEVVCEKLDSYLANIDERVGSWVTLGNIVDHAGGINEGARDKVVMAVCGIARESIGRSVPGTAVSAAAPGSAIPLVSAPLYIDVRLMFFANFLEGRYADGLAALSRVIGFFQQSPVFARADAPGLDPSIERVTLDFENLDPGDLNNIMGMFGARYLPSVFYRLRMLPFVSGAVQGRTYSVTAPVGAVTA